MNLMFYDRIWIDKVYFYLQLSQETVLFTFSIYIIKLNVRCDDSLEEHKFIYMY